MHFIEEACNGGPVHYRWMYPFERFLNKLKRTVEQKAHVERSICKTYVSHETTNFYSYYFKDDVRTFRRRLPHNDDGGVSTSQPLIYGIFNQVGHALGAVHQRYLTNSEWKAKHLHVLVNYLSVEVFIE